MQKITADVFMADLKAALDWAATSRGRALQLLDHARELFERTSGSSLDVIAMDEAAMARDVHLLWRHRDQDFPRTLPKIRECLSSGPWLPDDEERGKSHNRPRNDLFVFFLAGSLIFGGVDVVSVDGIPRRDQPNAGNADIIIAWSSARIVIECKRPYASDTLLKNIADANDQICRHGVPGIVAIDASRLVRPPGHVLHPPDEESAKEFLADQLKDHVMRQLAAEACEHVIGALAFARTPAVVVTGESSVLSPSGRPYQYEMTTSVLQWVTWKRDEVGRHVMGAITEALHKSLAALD